MTETKFTDYIKLPPMLSAREADDMLSLAKSGGAEYVVVLFDENDYPFSASCKNKIIALLRSAFRRKLKLIFSDDSFPFSGTAFGFISSVPDLWSREIISVSKDDFCESDILLSETNDNNIVARIVKDDRYPYGHYPNLMNKYAAELLRDFLYKKFLAEYKKFVSYEFSGFLSICPSYAPPFGSALAYNENLISHMDDKAISLLLSDDDKRADYISQCQREFEENYIIPLKTFCNENALTFSVLGGEKSASQKLCDNINCHKVSPLKETPLFSIVSSAMDNRIANLNAFDPCYPAFASLRRFLADIPDSCIRISLSASPTVLSTGDSFLLSNVSNEKRIFKITPPGGGWVIIDPENNASYAFENERDYEFSPYGFIFMKKSEGAIFSDELPVRVGAVRTKPAGETVFNIDGSFNNRFTFELPNIPLYGALLEIEGSFDSLNIKIGSRLETIISPPYCIPLFDFYCGAKTTISSENGLIEKIYISK